MLKQVNLCSSKILNVLEQHKSELSQLVVISIRAH